MGELFYFCMAPSGNVLTHLTVKMDVLTVQVKVSSSVLMATLKYKLLLRRYADKPLVPF